MRMDFKEMTRKIWESYICGEENAVKQEWFAPDCVIIGTGKHELYKNLAEFSEAAAQEIEERKNVKFQLKDFWCEVQELTPEICFVYGNVFIWWESEDKSIFINMDSRFTMLYKKIEAVWKIVHIHQSLPNAEQADGEYYPKTLKEQILKAQEETNIYAELANKDNLTGLFNYRAFEGIFEEEKRAGEWIFVIDLDDFKQINDTYGHMRGNKVLRKVAATLKSSVRSQDIVCRMGGDEFVILCVGIGDQTAAEHLMERIQKNMECAGETEEGWTHISVGGTRIEKGDSLEIAFKRADQALYDVKNHGKNGWKIV